MRRVIYVLMLGVVLALGIWLLRPTSKPEAAVSRPKATVSKPPGEEPEPRAPETTIPVRGQPTDREAGAGTQPATATAQAMDGPAMMEEIRYHLMSDPKRAERLAREYQKRFPGGADIEENDALLVYAMYNQRDVDRARAEALNYFKRHPNGKYTEKLSELTEMRPRRNR
ncbi:MAG: hypothetical protein JW940_01240 [Polyangiaceae bacterium]|nr:hypothetical protein [Polyangiaceae bacterium]